MSSRLFVKNLPKYVTEKRLKDHFSQRGEVTDVKIIKNKTTGISRQFGFIGYRTEKEAKEAIKYFSNSYLDTRKLEISIAKAAGDSSLPRPWSRHSKGSTAHKRQHPDEYKDINDEPQKKKAKLTNNDDAKKEYFMNLVKSSKGQLWKDDNLIPEAKKVSIKTLPDGSKIKIEDSYVESKKTGGKGVFYEKKKIVFADSDESEEDYQEFPSDNKNSESSNNEEQEDSDIVNDSTMSDMDYLRSKMISKDKLEDSESSSEDIIEDVSSVDHETSNSSDDQINKMDINDKTNETEAKRMLFGNESDDEDEDDIGESGRLFIRNLPFSTIEEDLVTHFSKYGELSEVHLPIDSETKQGKGFAFIQYIVPLDAAKAFDNLDNTIFQGRLLHILPAKSLTKTQSEAKLSSDARSSYKKKKELKAKQISNDDSTWNTIFLRSDTVANAIADSLQVKKSDIFNPEADNMAVRMALAEAQIIQETKKSLEEEGVNLDALKYHNAKDYKRSKTVILIKNLPFSTKSKDLYDLFSPFGTLGRVILPSTKAIALIEFAESNEAKNAFKNLKYKRFKHVPLYLEWTPELIFTTNSTLNNENNNINKKENKDSIENENIKQNIIENEEIDNTESSTLFIKNLNFSTTEDSLKEFFLNNFNENTIRSVRIAKSKGKKSQSLGYGFVELKEKQFAIKALKMLQGKTLDGHQIVMKFSQSNSKPKTKSKRKVSEKPSSKPLSSKLMIRNLAFEAEKKDLRQLCSPFGQIKAVRIPKKFDGRSRGYGFVEFLTKQDAKNAMDKLMDAHLYGRHLVIEYAEDKQASLDQLRKKVKDNMKN